MSCIEYSQIEKAVSFRGCAPAGAKALHDIGFAPTGAVDRSYWCAPRLNAPMMNDSATLNHCRTLNATPLLRNNAMVYRCCIVYTAVFWSHQLHPHHDIIDPSAGFCNEFGWLNHFFRLISGLAEFLRKLLQNSAKIRLKTTNSTNKTDKLRQPRYKQHNKGV